MDRILPYDGVSLYNKNLKGNYKTQSTPAVPNDQSPYRNSEFGDSKVIPQEHRMGILKDVYGEKKLKQLGLIECATCSARTYVDGSDDPGVSFKSPGKISPEASFAMVSAHEQEHVSNEQSDAAVENREVVAQSVQIFMSTCPECGKSYASGGVTRTTTAGKSTYNHEEKSSSGTLVDAKV